MDACKVNKLKIQQELLEKHTLTLLNNLNLLLEDDKLNISNKELEKQKQDVKNRFNSELMAIHNSLVKLAQSKDVELQYSKSVLVDINSAFLTIKEDNMTALQKLTVEEETYIRDLEILEKRIDGFLKTNPAKLSLIGKPPIKNKLNAQIGKAEGTNKEVQEFQSFLLMSGGHFGGWDDQDHQLFLKHRRKLKGSHMADALHILLPDIPPEVIIEHEEWYRQYEILRAQQLHAIKAWRDSSRKENVDVVSQKSKSKEVKVDPVALKELAEKKKQQIQEWKLKKQELKLIEENEKAKRMDKICSEEIEKMEERERQKQVIQEYKLKKAFLKEAKLTQKISQEEKRNMISDRKLVAMFQERDRLHISRIMKRTEEAKKPVEDCIPKVVAERDPERLLRPTKAWVQHVDQREELESSNMGAAAMNYVNHLPHLKVPNWRKNL